ncbi:hypothetical protein EJ069_07830 [Mesorhizobium sp. M2A.F.Ca.ET.043.05.1.1]|nr:hypothetical protein EJ069_07830 [Mesorhizobium sp. M2A.F.Ca.ET.043.05.1.1]
MRYVCRFPALVTKSARGPTGGFGLGEAARAVSIQVAAVVLVEHGCGLLHMQAQDGARRRRAGGRFGPDQPCLHWDLLKIIYCHECRSAGRDDRNLQFQTML